MLGVWMAIAISAALPTDYPFQLEGADGFKYFIITDAQSENFFGRDGRPYARRPVLSSDGSALYDGRRIDSSGKLRWIRVSYQQLLDENRLPGAQIPMPDYRSPLDRNSLQLEVSAPLVQRVLQELQANSAESLKGSPSMTPRKVEVIRRILFEPEVLLSREDLKDLARNHENPDPPPSEFAIEVSAVIPEDLRPLANGRYVPRRTIQIDELIFSMSRRWIIFDPARNRFRVELIADRARIQGPINDTGDVIFLMDYRWWDEYYNLDFGEVGGMRMSFDLQFEAEDDQFWLLQIVPHTFNIEFVDPEPRVDMKVSGYRRNGDPYFENEVLPLIPAAQKEVQRKLTDMIAGALSSRFFTEGLSFKLPVSVLDEWIYPSRFLSKARLSQLQVLPEGLLLGFDSQFEVDRVSECLEGLGVQDEPAQQYPLPRREAQGNRWALVWKKSGAWDLMQELNGQWAPANLAEARIGLDVKTSVFNRSLYAAWRAGSFCVSTKSWWPRPGHIPLIMAVPYESPKLLLVEEDIWELKVPVELVHWRRDLAEPREQFSIRELGKRFDFSARLAANSDFRHWVLFDLELNSKDLTAEEIQLVTSLVSSVLRESQLIPSDQSVEGFSKRVEWQSLETTGWSLEQMRGWPSEDQTRFVVNLQEESIFGLMASTPTGSTPDLTRFPLRTALSKRPPFLVTDDFVEFAFGPESMRYDEKVFYTYRWREPSGEWTAWSLFDERQQTLLPLESEGLYQFEVKAMNRWFEIEGPGYPRYEFYHEVVEAAASEPIPEGATREAWQAPEATVAESEKSNKELAAENIPPPHRAESKGLFGCGVQARNESSLWLFLFFILLLALRDKSGRRYGNFT